MKKSTPVITSYSIHYTKLYDYRQENLDPALLQRLLEVAWHAPTGRNARQVRFTVVDDRAKLAALRDEGMAGLARLVREDALPESLAYFADFVRLWEEQGVDTLFRGAPHLLIASAPQNVACPAPDCLIALSYFELYAVITSYSIHYTKLYDAMTCRSDSPLYGFVMQGINLWRSGKLSWSLYPVANTYGMCSS